MRMILAVLLCSSGMVITNTVHGSPEHTRVPHKQHSGPRKKQLQQDLGDAIRHAIATTNHALSVYSTQLKHATDIQRAQSIGSYLETLRHDQSVLMQYLEQLITGDPALSRDDIQSRIQQIQTIQERWNM